MLPKTFAKQPEIQQPVGAMLLRYTIRSRHRFPVSCTLYYLGRDLLGKGLTLDLSPRGWRVRGDASVRQGQRLAFRLRLPQGSEMLDIPRAIVRWTKGDEFGVEVLQAGPPAQAHLHRFILDRASFR